MASALTDRRSAAAGPGTPARPGAALASPATVPELWRDVPPDGAGAPGQALPDQALPDQALPGELLADLDHPDLVLSEGYIGPERRAGGLLARLRRATFSQRRSLLTLEFAVIAVVAAVVVGVVVTGPAGPAGQSRPTAARHTGPSTRASTRAPAASTPATPPPSAVTPSTAAPAPVAAAPAPPPTTPATAPPATAPAPDPSSLTPDQLGAEALAMVRYPWQQIPGYSIQFQPIADAPSPGFYGNTTFTWGHTGGTSVLYVYPGETAARLAGIIGFEIAHEVDAAAVYPGGGETQIENVLNYHPASWAPDCDCGEQGFLSGWYAAAFSNYWTPGVGNWSQLPVAPPSGATLSEIASWLNPAIP